MTAPPPASPPPKMSQPTDQERAKAHSLAVEIVDNVCGYTAEHAPSQREHQHLYRLAAEGIEELLATARAEGRAEQRKRDAAKARAYCMCGLDGCHESIAAAIEKETT